MEIDLNKPESLTFESVQNLLASKDDSASRQLRVSHEGVAYLSDEVGNHNLDNTAFRLETWLSGNGYTGKEASQDSSWINRVLKVLRDNWPSPSESYIDVY